MTLHLADLASCSGAYPKHTDDQSRAVRAAHKLVLPLDTLNLVQHLRTQLPPVINQMRRSARPPFPVMFVEANLADYCAALGMDSPDPRGVDSRTGLLIVDDSATKRFIIYIIDSVGDLRRNGTVLNWPLRYAMSYGDDPLPLPSVANVPAYVEQMVWGYSDEVPIGPLSRMAWCEPRNNVPMELSVKALRETQGVLRYAVALLSLLNSTGTLERVESPKQARVLVHGQSHRATTPSIVRVEVGSRVRDREAYVLKHAREGVRKALHDVRGHYRHVARQPLAAHASGSPWEPWEGGWRRWIDNHERGDESLGDLRGRTIVPVAPHPTPY